MTTLDVEIKEAETELELWTERLEQLRREGAPAREIRLTEGAVNAWDERLFELRTEKSI